jgi:hypothetical protein
VLTDTAARNATPKERDYKLADSGGLHLFVTTKGSKSWRLKFRHGGKEKLLVLGKYPDVTLKGARVLREEAKAALAQGRDPVLEAKRTRLVGQAKVHDTFEKHARAWHDARKAKWKPVHAADVLSSLERDIFPDLGRYPIEDIDGPLLLAVLRKVEDRGAIETARRLRQRCERIFKWAKAHGARCDNPAEAVKEAMKQSPRRSSGPRSSTLRSCAASFATSTKPAPSRRPSWRRASSPSLRSAPAWCAACLGPTFTASTGAARTSRRPRRCGRCRRSR